MTPFVRAGWNSAQDVSARIEVVHRLDDAGAVFINVVNGTSTEGFDAEWRMVELMTVDGDLISRAELFDEADLDVALAKFDELTRLAPRMGNGQVKRTNGSGRASWRAIGSALLRW